MGGVVHLDANDNATVFDELGKGNAVICFLVQCFVEEDDSADAAVDALVGCEEQLAVAAPVLLRVLNPDGGEAFGHAAYRHTHAHTRMNRKLAVR